MGILIILLAHMYDSLITKNNTPTKCSFLTSSAKVILYFPDLYNKNISSTVQIKLNNFKNPSSTYPYTLQCIFTYGSGNSVFATSSASITASIAANALVVLQDYV